MFKKKSRSESAADTARQQAAALRGKAAVGAGAAGGAAYAAAANARDWATPRLERARDLGVEKAAPRVESAARALGPRVDEVHDRIVDDVLPKVVAAVSAAADAAAERVNEAQKASHDQLDSMATVAKRANRQAKTSRAGGFGRVLLIFSGLAGVFGAGYYAWKRMNAPTDDPWATASSSVRASPSTNATPPVKPAPVKPTSTTGTGPADNVTPAAAASAKPTPAGDGDTVEAKGHVSALPSDNVEPLPPVVEKGDPLATDDAADAKPGDTSAPKPGSGANDTKA